MKHTATLKEHELTWNMMNQVWELTAIIEIDGKDMQLYVPLSEYPRRMYIKLYKENQQIKEMLYKCREKLDELDYGCEVWQGELTGFIEEIDNAIGENK